MGVIFSFVALEFSDSEIRTELGRDEPEAALFLLRLILLLLARLVRVFELEKFVKMLWGNSSFRSRKTSDCCTGANYCKFHIR